MKRFHQLLLACTLAVVCCAAVAAAEPAPQMNIGPINPAKPAWGESAQFSVYVWSHGPVVNQSVECWFSGRHGMQTPHWTVRTNAEGRATFTRTIPREWKTLDTWVDFNASCDPVALRGMWRVRGK